MRNDIVGRGHDPADHITITDFVKVVCLWLIMIILTGFMNEKTRG